jgi:hypothetical protein
LSMLSSLTQSGVLSTTPAPRSTQKSNVSMYSCQQSNIH